MALLRFLTILPPQCRPTHTRPNPKVPASPPLTRRPTLRQQALFFIPKNPDAQLLALQAELPNKLIGAPLNEWTRSIPSPNPALHPFFNVAPCPNAQLNLFRKVYLFGVVRAVQGHKVVKEQARRQVKVGTPPTKIEALPTECRS